MAQPRPRDPSPPREAKRPRVHTGMPSHPSSISSGRPSEQNPSFAVPHQLPPTTTATGSLDPAEPGPSRHFTRRRSSLTSLPLPLATDSPSSSSSTSLSSIFSSGSSGSTSLSSGAVSNVEKNPFSRSFERAASDPTEGNEPSPGDVASPVNDTSTASSVSFTPITESLTAPVEEQVDEPLAVFTAPAETLPVSGSLRVPQIQVSVADLLSPPSGAGTNPLASTLARDALLTYAYRLYETPQHPPLGLSPIPVFDPAPSATPGDVYRAQLIPLLNTLRSLHPSHLPTILLLGCVYHAIGDYDTSIELNQEILSIEPNYVEAMSNMGTTMKAVGRAEDAYKWWWKALERRPTYWDSMDNLLHMVLATAAERRDEEDQDATPHYRKALEICQYVQSRVVGHDGRLIIAVPSSQLFRLQNVFYTSATIHRFVGGDGLVALSTALELVIRPPAPYTEEERYSILDLVLAIYMAGLIALSNPNSPLPEHIEEAMAIEGEPPFSVRIRDLGHDLLASIHKASARLVDALVSPRVKLIPMLLLSPDQVMRLPHSIFPATVGVVPSICTRPNARGPIENPPDAIRQQCHSMSCTILLGLAKRVQDTLSGAEFGLASFQGKIQASTSLTMLFYYLALALSPSPAIYNNMGLILSSLSPMDGGRQGSPTGAQLARAYYEKGLQLDPNHPHLLTNMGSLLKDAGQTSEAIRLYMRAIQYKPDFDIALANLGNAMKDIGRPWEAVSYYRRALKSNPSLGEAVCGLATSLSSICDWRGRGGIAPDIMVDDIGDVTNHGSAETPGWMTDMINVCDQQLRYSYSRNIGVVASTQTLGEWLDLAQQARGSPFKEEVRRQWKQCFARFYEATPRAVDSTINEAGFVIRLIEWLQRRLQRKWYLQAYGKVLTSDRPVRPINRRHHSAFLRPVVPAAIEPPQIPSVLPFHTFTGPLSVRTIRLISHRNALRLSHTALTSHWLPQHVYPPPPPPPNGRLNIGYVSGDLNDHPLAHLMGSVFGLHSKSLNIFVYSTSPSDGSYWRRKIENDSNFVDVSGSSWTTGAIVDRIVADQIHILINLGGYTKGARNEIFAARPSPIQISLMGFAGTLGAGWCDYLVCDPIACPRYLSASEQWRKFSYLPKRAAGGGMADSTLDLIVDFDATLDPEGPAGSWMYTEKLLYLPHTYLVTDHKQSHRDDEHLSVEERAGASSRVLWDSELKRRREWRAQIFPDLPSDWVIFANFNQLYKVCPLTFQTWLRILKRVPKSILWLLRFPAAGEEHLIRTAKAWADDDVASRIRFTDVADKRQHVRRGRVADLFLDTMECNAHTVAADALWSGTPLVTWPRHPHKMASRVGASIACATGYGEHMVVDSAEEYEERAVFLATNVKTPGPSEGTEAQGEGALLELRRNLFLNRDRMALFDTERWTMNLEKGLREAWRRWVEGTEFEGSDEWEACEGSEKESGCIWVQDDEPTIRPALHDLR